MASRANTVAVVHYNEVALKLGARPMFVNRLVQNVRSALLGLPVESVRAAEGRITVVFDPGAQADVLHRLAQTPGIANVIAAEGCVPDLDVLEERMRERLAAWRPRGSFRVLVKRADKSFPMKSPEIAARLGALVARVTRAPVSLKSPDSTVWERAPYRPDSKAPNRDGRCLPPFRCKAALRSWDRSPK